jgi:Cu-Zn family superoxide dismutase
MTKKEKFGIAILFDNKFHRKGVVHFEQKKELKIHVYAETLTPGLHGFHIHQSGDLSEGCKSLCDHYNPDNTTHGGPRSKSSHRGDLGNISVNKKGIVDSNIKTKKLSLSEILGRSAIIHADKDDLGRGGNEESLKTGNAGKRVLCGVIGIAKRKYC